jgi:hypothetical protein
MSLINTTDLQNYAERGYNVLFEGKHGVGKTAIIQQTFDELGWKWLYFSAATLDPWVDLIGVPKAKTMANGEEELTLVRPSFILADDIQGIFFDELNRAPDKVLNAVMELIQFKSINGHKLKNLKVIWAAINPWDDENTYAVNEMDPALCDRFQVKIPVPYKVDEDWFASKWPETGRTFCSWWNLLEPDMKNQISPRRLSYAADAFANSLKMSDILPSKAPLKKLKDSLASVPFLKKVEGLKTEEQVKAFLSKINNVTDLLKLVKDQNPAALPFFSKHKHLIPKEVIAATIPEDGASDGKKQNHKLAEHAYESLMRGVLTNPKHIFDVEAAAKFKLDFIFQVDILQNPKFNFFHVLVEELRLYKSASKAASDRVLALTGKAVEYLSHVDFAVFNAHDKGVVGLLAAIIVVDNGEQFTKPRAEFLANKLRKQAAIGGSLNCLAIADLLQKTDASRVAEI